MPYRPISTRLLGVEEFQRAIQGLQVGDRLRITSFDERRVSAVVYTRGGGFLGMGRQVGDLSNAIARKVAEYESSGGFVYAVVTKRLPLGAEIDVCFTDDVAELKPASKPGQDAVEIVGGCGCLLVLVTALLIWAC